jgi:hypothetical protein
MLRQLLCRKQQREEDRSRNQQQIELEQPQRYLLSFGKPDHGKLGHGDAQIQRSLPTIVEALRCVDIVKVASMSTYALAIDSK